MNKIDYTIAEGLTTEQLEKGLELELSCIYENRKRNTAIDKIIEKLKDDGEIEQYKAMKKDDAIMTHDRFNFELLTETIYNPFPFLDNEECRRYVHTDEVKESILNELEISLNITKSTDKGNHRNSTWCFQHEYKELLVENFGTSVLTREKIKEIFSI